MDRFTQLCLWTDESLVLAQEFQQLLSREHKALLSFRGEELAEITMSKERGVARIAALRKQIQDAGRAWFGIESSEELEKKISPEQAKIWNEKLSAWRAEWKQTRKQAERSQFFLKHSQRNLGSLIENWRRLLGETPLYSAKGRKVDAPSTGKVFEAKY